MATAEHAQTYTYAFTGKSQVQPDMSCKFLFLIFYSKLKVESSVAAQHKQDLKSPQ